MAANDPPGDEVSLLTAEARGYRTATRSARHSLEEDQGLCLEREGL